MFFLLTTVVQYDFLYFRFSSDIASSLNKAMSQYIFERMLEVNSYLTFVVTFMIRTVSVKCDVPGCTIFSTSRVEEFLACRAWSKETRENSWKNVLFVPQILDPRSLIHISVVIFGQIFRPILVTTSVNQKSTRSADFPLIYHV